MSVFDIGDRKSDISNEFLASGSSKGDFDLQFNLLDETFGSEGLLSPFRKESFSETCLFLKRCSGPAKDSFLLLIMLRVQRNLRMPLLTF